ncbi:MG2 domain-containing protein [Haliangium sp.]|uniref:alpha-2-macroglobulin family protein n=1 Tax=Haliangium sp. TaxID=2663208 RepID=UPI003D0C9752
MHVDLVRPARVFCTAAAQAASVVSMVAVVALAAGCDSDAPGKAELTVTSFAPDKVSYDPDTVVQIQFGAPVVEDTELGQALAAAPAKFEPAVPFEAHWLDRQTLVLTPSQPLTASTRYQVTLTGALGDRTDEASFSFVNMPLVVYGVGGEVLDRVPASPRLALQFNQEVRGQDVVEHCFLRAPASEDKLALESSDREREDSAITVTPAAALTQDRDYELVCDGLSGAAGDAPLAEAFVQALHTYPPFALRRFGPEGDAVPADDVEIELVFATPVELDEVRKHLSMNPEVQAIRNGWMDQDRTRYRVNLNLDTTTSYTITIAAGLADVYGQRLDEAVTHDFGTSDARPRISMETGIYALETHSQGYPMWSRNVGRYQLDCAKLSPAQVTKTLTTRINYSGWGGDDEDIDWEELGLSRQSHTEHIEQAKNKWHLDHLDLGAKCGGQEGARGLYLAQVSSEDITPDLDREWAYRPYQRVLANVTDLGALLKVGNGSGLVWVTRMSDGKPVGGAKVTLYDDKGTRRFSGTTDKDGLVRTPGRSKLLPPESNDDDDDDDGDGEYDGYGYGYGGDSSHSGRRVIAVIEAEGDMAVVDGNWSDGIETWNFGVTRDRRDSDTEMRGFIQSDRGIYRPGETVHFKGLVREVAVGKAPAVPRRRNIEVTVRSSRGATVYEEGLTLSSFGGFHFDLPLPPEADLGDYSVVATLGGQTFREKFSVEEFRKVSFEVAVRAADQHPRLGETMHVDVSADYLFGEPVRGGTVEWQVQRRRHRISVPGFGGYAFSDYAAESNSYWWYRSSSEDYYYLSDGKGSTNKRGTLRLAVRDPARNVKTPQDYLITVTVRDPTDQAVQKSVVVTGHRSEFYLGLRTKEYVQRVGTPVELDLVAVTPKGERAATQATVTLIRRTWRCNYTEGYRSYSRCEREEKVALTRQVSISATGSATGSNTERFDVSEPGSYIVRVDGKDSRGNEVAASSYMWVTGSGRSIWEDDGEPRFDLVASKPDYKPGETARLVPQTGLDDATALITIERGGVIEAQVKPLASPAEGIDVALSDIHAPNVFASVALVRGRTGPQDHQRPRFQMGVTELKVSSAAKRLEVVVTTDKDSYEPGETVTGTVQVRSNGAPVVAEVSLSVADEGVLQLINYKTPDPMQRFYAGVGLGVDSATNLTRIARLDDPSDVDYEYGADFGGDDESGPGRVRSRFVSSAFWAPALVTDANGEARVSFAAPDNLTAFRFMAVAADEGARFGSGERRITVKKPLLAKPVLPRFFTAGDRGEVGVVVHNYTGQDGTVEVTATAEGARLRKEQQSVQVAAGDSVRVRFPARAGFAKEANFEFAVRMDSYQDALRLSVPINRPYIYQRKVLARGELGEGDATRFELPLAWDEALVKADSIVTVSVDRTGLSGLEQGLRYLIEYPYGCLEQTLSRFIPLTKVKDLAQSLELEELEKTPLDQFVRAGAAKVARHQDRDSGHFSLWPGGETYPHLTVYALYGLNEAKRAGVSVDEQAMARGIEAMRAWATSGERTLGPGGESATVAMAAYLLAELDKPDTGLNARLFEVHRALPRYGQAFLLRALHKAKAPASQRRSVQESLFAELKRDGAGVLVREPKPEDYYMDSDVRTSAIALSALLEVDPQNELVPGLVEGLMKQQRGGRWHNTQENLYALVALADHARRQAKGTALVTLYRGQKRQIRRRLDGHETLVFRRSARNLGEGPLVIEAEGKVHYVVRVDEARKDQGDTAVSQGFAITREYLDPSGERPVDKVRAGQLVRIKVTVESDQDRRYVALVDPLPAGFEAVNPRLATNTAEEEDEDDGYVDWDEDRWVDYGWSYRELRDDEARAFADELPEGKYTFEYLARATLPGTFIALPARAEAMYDPDVTGRSVAGQVIVRK